MGVAPGGSALAGGVSGALGAGLGALPGLIGQLAGNTDPRVAAGLGAVGAVGAPAALGALGSTGVLGSGAVGAGAGSATAGAGAGLAAAAPALWIAAPYLAATLVKAFTSDRDDQQAMFNAKSNMRRFMGNMNDTFVNWNQMPNLLKQLNNATPEQARQIYDQIQKVQDQFGGSGMEQFLATGGTGSSPGSGFADIEFPAGPKIMEGFRPQMTMADIGRLRAIDQMARAGVDVSKMPLADPFIAAQTFGSMNRYRDPESGNASMSNVYNPYLTEHFDKPTREAFAKDPSQQAIFNEYGTQVQTPNFSARQPVYDPEAMKAIGALKPGNLESGLAELYGNQYANPLLSQYGFGTGTTNFGGGVGGQEANTAGRLTPPNVLTGTRTIPRPEADSRAEAAFGMRPQQGGQDASGRPIPPPAPGTSGSEAKPFGMVPGGGFAVQPGGTIGTGGLRSAPPFSAGTSRNTMTGAV